jgi:hypothetical protein
MVNGKALSNKQYEREKNKIRSNLRVYGLHLKDVPKVFQADKKIVWQLANIMVEGT